MNYCLWHLLFLSNNNKTQLGRWVLYLEMCFSLSKWFWFDYRIIIVCSCLQFWTKAMRFQKQDRWRKHFLNRKSDRTLAKRLKITLDGKYWAIICIKWQCFVLSNGFFIWDWDVITLENFFDSFPPLDPLFQSKVTFGNKSVWPSYALSYVWPASGRTSVHMKKRDTPCCPLLPRPPPVSPHQEPHGSAGTPAVQAGGGCWWRF